MTNFILLIGAGLFSKAVGNFQTYEFNHLCVPPPLYSALSLSLLHTCTLANPSSYIARRTQQYAYVHM